MIKTIIALSIISVLWGIFAYMDATVLVLLQAKGSIIYGLSFVYHQVTVQIIMLLVAYRVGSNFLSHL